MPRRYNCGYCNKMFLGLGYVLEHSEVCPLKKPSSISIVNNINSPNNINIPNNINTGSKTPTIST